MKFKGLMLKCALVTGICSQDGAYLARVLVDKGYEVHGGVRSTACIDSSRLRMLGVDDIVHLHEMNLLDPDGIGRTFDAVGPSEVYNLAAQSLVSASFDAPIQTMAANAIAVVHMLDWIRKSGGTTRFYQASSSEMFGPTQGLRQDETSPFRPQSPYAQAKLAAHMACVHYREHFGLHASSGILFNHESPLRPPQFVTRKITSTLARIAVGHNDVLSLGNLDAKRDWGFAGDYVVGMWSMLQQACADDFVLATGQACSVRTFVEKAARRLGWEMEWRGMAHQESGHDRRTGKLLVVVNPQFYRPVDPECTFGEPAKAEAGLGWMRSVDLDGLVEMMVEHDLRVATDTTVYAT